MSKNPFAADAVPEEKIKRNAYDLSRQNLFSTHFGRLTPCFLEEVIPGDTFEIDSSLVIQGMPTVFPLQTRCRVSVEFYYSRNRCVYDDFEDFIFKTKDGLEQPWLRLNIERAKKMISTNSLGDMFGLPTTYASDSTIFRESACTTDGYMWNRKSPTDVPGVVAPIQLTAAFPSASPLNSSLVYSSCFSVKIAHFDSILIKDFYFQISENVSITDPGLYYFYLVRHSDNLPIDLVQCTFTRDEHDNKYLYAPYDNTEFDDIDIYLVSTDSSTDDDKYYPKAFFCNFPYGQGIPANGAFTAINVTTFRYPFKTTGSTNGVIDITDSSVIDNCPFIGNTPSIKVNALPFRHYEMICNYYYRNDKNNPYFLNGQAQYNEFIPTHDGGADDNEYLYHYKNWELDRFTSATQSPQFGDAPLVGLTFTGSDTAKIEFQDADNPDSKYYAEVGLDGDRVSSIEDFSQDIPSANLRRLQEMIHYGISINDLRVTNSFQRFLENTMRRGLRYRNQLKSHFGVSVDYPDIDIPQYIGGYSGELNVSKVTSTAQTSEANLGDFNGQLSGVIQSQHKIKHYCTEHGFIIGIMSITPIPVYTQTCNKVMIKNNPFDYYLPEFGKIGHVPIHYSEVMPLQTGDDQSVDDVFGYQRAWYDYMRSFDQAHGYFRTNLKDFVLQRLFAERPELVEDFTVIKPEQLTDVFVTRNIADAYNVDDKFLCNFYVHCVVARQIPRFGTPSLE